MEKCSPVTLARQGSGDRAGGLRKPSTGFSAGSRGEAGSSCINILETEDLMASHLSRQRLEDAPQVSPKQSSHNFFFFFEDKK